MDTETKKKGEQGMALTKEDKAEVREIIQEEIGPLRAAIESLQHAIGTIENKMDAMMEMLAPLLYAKHDITNLRTRMERAERDIAELKRQ